MRILPVHCLTVCRLSLWCCFWTSGLQRCKNKTTIRIKTKRLQLTRVTAKISSTKRHVIMATDNAHSVVNLSSLLHNITW